MESKPRMCRKCGQSPCLPSRAARGDYLCSLCFNGRPANRVAQRKYNRSQKGHARQRAWLQRNPEWNRARMEQYLNPRKAFYRLIGLGQFNELTSGGWRG